MTAPAGPHVADAPGDPGAVSPVGLPEPWAKERTLAVVATDGVVFLVYWLVIMILVSQAVTAWVRPPGGDGTLGLTAAMTYVSWAVFCLAVGVRRGRGPKGTELAPPVWLPFATSAGCLASLAVLREMAHVSGLWPSQVLVAGLVTVSLTVWAGPFAGGLSAVILAIVVVLIPVARSLGPGQLRTPLAAAIPAFALMAAGFAVALALSGLRRSALQFQATLDARDEVLVRERTVQMSADLSNEVERSLHDTALNTLETIAAHGDHLDPEVVAARCRADDEALSRWSTSSRMVDLAHLLERLLAHADNIGLTVAVEVMAAEHPPREPVGPTRGPRVLRPRAAMQAAQGITIPGPVLTALDGAAREALTNVAKHSGRRRATVRVRHEADGVELVVSDDGVGVGETAARGFGLKWSVRDRMAAAGGTAAIGPGPDGRGTSVVLGWWPQPEPDTAEDGPHLLVRAAEISVAIGLVLAAIASAFIVLGWPGYAFPVPALAAAVLPVGVAAWILSQARSRGGLGPGHVIAACATYILVGAVAVLADPYCSSLLGENVMLDARAPMLAVVLLLWPNPWVLAAQAGTVLVAHFGGALAWSDQWPGCGPDTAGAGVYVVAGLVAAWLFVGRITSLTEQFVLARSQAAEAQVRIGAQVAVRAEQEAWVLTTLTSAQALLSDLASGAKLPSDPQVRAECATEAQFLRGLLAVGRAPEPTRRPARIWLLLMRVSGCQVSVRGSFASCRPSRETIRQVGGVIDALCALAPASTVTLTAFDEPTAGSLILSASGPTVLEARDGLLVRADALAPDAWRDATEDTFSVEWTWAHPDDARGVGG